MHKFPIKGIPRGLPKYVIDGQSLGALSRAIDPTARGQMWSAVRDHKEVGTLLALGKYGTAFIINNESECTVHLPKGLATQLDLSVELNIEDRENLSEFIEFLISKVPKAA